MKHRWATYFVTVTLGLGILATGAEASVKGRRNTTYGLGAATLWELAHGKGTAGLVLGGVTYYSYEKYRQALKAERRKHRHRWHRPYGWDQGQKRGWDGSSVPPGWNTHDNNWKWHHGHWWHKDQVPVWQHNEDWKDR